MGQKGKLLKIPAIAGLAVSMLLHRFLCIFAAVPKDLSARRLFFSALWWGTALRILYLAIMALFPQKGARSR